jgi:hypothetical protein
MSDPSKLNLRKSLAIKMIAYILVSIMVIFSLVFITTTAHHPKNSHRQPQKQCPVYEPPARWSVIDKVLSSIKRVPDNFAELIRDNELAEVRIIQELVELMVENNEDIEGACFAYEPYYKSDTQKYYSMYYYRKGGKLHSGTLVMICTTIFLMDWYQVPK